MSALPTPITTQVLDDCADKSDALTVVRLSILAGELEKDCMTLALRLYAEPDNTFSPPTREVMKRWAPRVRALLEEIT